MLLKNPKNTIEYYNSGERLRYRKDGSLDMRYKKAKALKERDKAPIRVGRSIPKKRAEKLTLTEKILKWVGIAMLVSLVYAEFKNSYGIKEYDASLYRTAYAMEAGSIETTVSGERAYMENPQTMDQIKDYMRYKFGKNYQVACMVAYGESLRNPTSVASKPLECSIGIYQINLKDNYCLGNRIHWDKVEGEDLKDKISWLQNPKNNIDLAYKMSSGGEDWGQWGAYANGSYLQFGDECN
jgi:hypothetical protein